MKTLFLFLISFTFFLPVDTEVLESTSSSEMMEPGGGKLEVEVEFGRKRKGCTGFGICSGKISFTSGDIKPLEKGAFATLEGGQEGEPFIMNFYKKSMNERTIKTYFSGDYFIMKEGFKEVLKSKNDKVKINLKAGKYKINKSKEGFKVKFAR